MTKTHTSSEKLCGYLSADWLVVILDGHVASTSDMTSPNVVSTLSNVIGSSKKSACVKFFLDINTNHQHCVSHTLCRQLNAHLTNNIVIDLLDHLSMLLILQPLRTTNVASRIKERKHAQMAPFDRV